MTIEEQVLQKLRGMPPEKQNEVLNFVALLESKIEMEKPHRSLLRLWTDLNVEITEEDIAETRREVWADLSRASNL